MARILSGGFGSSAWRAARFAQLVFLLGTLSAGAQESLPDAVSKAAKNAPVNNALDPVSGLIVAEHWELVRAHCGACHSYRLVTANRGNRDYWLNTLRWMQRTQNLWPIPEQQEKGLLDYLAANYSESEWGRRPPLSPALLPD